MYLCTSKSIWGDDGLQVSFTTQGPIENVPTKGKYHEDGNNNFRGEDDYKDYLATFVVGDEYSALPDFSTV